MSHEDLAHGHLAIALSCAVPLWIELFTRQPYAHVLERARVCGQAVAEHGDLIQFRSKRKGGSAEAFNRLAEGIAALAFAPGGVHTFGLHFEAKHPEAP